MVVAHRGASGHEEEHTWKAYDKAIEMGADYIEQDLQLTQDGHLVISHDSTVDRMTDGTGKISDMNLSEIKRLRTPQGQQILTLDEVLRHYGTSIKYYIETKRPQSQAMDDELVRLLVKHNLIGIDRVKEQVIIQSFSKESLQNIHEQYSDIFLVYLLKEPTISDLNEAVEFANGIGPRFASDKTNKSLVDAAHARGLLVHPYTVNSNADIQKVISYGVDGFFTNYPDRGVALFKG